MRAGAAAAVAAVTAVAAALTAGPGPAVAPAAGPGRPGAPAATLQAPPAQIIGRSVLGRPIGVTRSGDPLAPTKVLVVGCIHGDECAGRGVVAVLRRLPPSPGTQLLLVTNANPDGLARRTRQNARGVDLNRNAAQGWRDLGPVGTRFHAGRRPFSEPETRALRRLILRERPALTIWFHQPLALVDLPEAGSGAPARRYARLAGLPLRRLPAYPGSLSRWQNARVRPGSSFVVELPRGRLGTAAALRHAAAVTQALPRSMR